MLSCSADVLVTSEVSTPHNGHLIEEASFDR